ncbi:MAG: HD domain-containing protein, partial [Spirochaetes bacterium]|nr:HD domain-containing protein [Spirochaetota bacterium]
MDHEKKSVDTPCPLLSYSEALELLRRYDLDAKTIYHSERCAEKAYELAFQIHSKHPDLPLDPEKVRIGALLHDIGKAQPGEHEINSVEILQKEGFPELAKIVCHSYPYEILVLKGSHRPEYLPSSLENKIVIYADYLIDPDGNPTTMEERIQEIKKRKKDQIDRMR